MSEDLKAYVSGKRRGLPDEEIKIPYFQFSPENVLNRSFIFYGLTGSYKTTLLYELMYQCRKSFSIVVVFSPTAQERGEYVDVVPLPLIFRDFDYQTIRRWFDWQRSRTELYNIANNQSNLEQLFQMVATYRDKQSIRDAKEKRNNAIKQVNKNSEPEDFKEEQRNKIRDICQNVIINIYKNTIRKYKNQLSENPTLSENHRIVLQFLDCNPYTLFIFDDAQTKLGPIIKEGKSKGGDVIKEILTRGRGNLMTSAWMFQQVTNIGDTSLRSNAFCSILCDSTIASPFFNRSGSEFSKQEQARAEAVINKIFHDPDDPDKKKKLIYIRDSSTPFRYIIRPIKRRNDFKVCSPIIIRYLEKVTKNPSQINTTNNPIMKQMLSRLD